MEQRDDTYLGVPEDQAGESAPSFVSGVAQGMQWLKDAYGGSVDTVSQMVQGVPFGLTPAGDALGRGARAAGFTPQSLPEQWDEMNDWKTWGRAAGSVYRGVEGAAGWAGDAIGLHTWRDLIPGAGGRLPANPDDPPEIGRTSSAGTPGLLTQPPRSAPWMDTHPGGNQARSEGMASGVSGPLKAEAITLEGELSRQRADMYGSPGAAEEGTAPSAPAEEKAGSPSSDKQQWLESGLSPSVLSAAENLMLEKDEEGEYVLSTVDGSPVPRELVRNASQSGDKVRVMLADDVGGAIFKWDASASKFVREEKSAFAWGDGSEVLESLPPVVQDQVGALRSRLQGSGQYEAYGGDSAFYGAVARVQQKQKEYEQQRAAARAASDALRARANRAGVEVQHAQKRIDSLRRAYENKSQRGPASTNPGNLKSWFYDLRRLGSTMLNEKKELANAERQHAAAVSDAVQSRMGYNEVNAQVSGMERDFGASVFRELASGQREVQRQQAEEYRSFQQNSARLGAAAQVVRSQQSALQEQISGLLGMVEGEPEQEAVAAAQEELRALIAKEQSGAQLTADEAKRAEALLQANAAWNELQELRRKEEQILRAQAINSGVFSDRSNGQQRQAGGQEAAPPTGQQSQMLLQRPMANVGTVGPARPEEHEARPGGVRLPEARQAAPSRAPTQADAARALLGPQKKKETRRATSVDGRPKEEEAIPPDAIPPDQVESLQPIELDVDLVTVTTVEGRTFIGERLYDDGTETRFRRRDNGIVFSIPNRRIASVKSVPRSD